MASMAAFNDEMASSRSFGGWDLGSMTKLKSGRCEGTVWRVGCVEESKPTPRANSHLMKETVFVVEAFYIRR